MERLRITAVSRRAATGLSDQFPLVASTALAPARREAVEFGRFLDQTEGVSQAEQLLELLFAFAINFDCPWIAYRPITGDKNVLKPVRRDTSNVLSYPDDWQERYFEMGYDRIDPIIKKGQRQKGAFRWSELYNDVSTTEGERLIFDEAATFGLRSGLSVPLHGPGGSCAIMSFVRPFDREIENGTITYLQLAASHFYLRVAEAISSHVERAPILSEREKECILWVARGKSSWDIGTILGISQNTANYHVKNVMRKLDVNSRTAAAIKAMSFGIIEL